MNICRLEAVRATLVTPALGIKEQITACADVLVKL
jgi:hypothetical protein